MGGHSSDVLFFVCLKTLTSPEKFDGFRVRSASPCIYAGHVPSFHVTPESVGRSYFHNFHTFVGFTTLLPDRRHIGARSIPFSGFRKFSRPILYCVLKKFSFLKIISVNRNESVVPIFASFNEILSKDFFWLIFTSVIQIALALCSEILTPPTQQTGGF